MLFIFFALASSQYFPDGFVPPPRRQCEQQMRMNDCWGPAVSTENVCLWDAADGLCSEYSEEDMESTCNIFMEDSSCTSRTFCAWNDSDLKCESHEQNVETEYSDTHLVNCAIQPRERCNDYAGFGTECAWHAMQGKCTRGYAGNSDFLCQSFDGTQCWDVGLCMYDDTLGCVSRLSHLNDFPEAAFGNGESEGPTLTKTHNTSDTNNKITFLQIIAMVSIGLLFGVLTGLVGTYLCRKPSKSPADMDLYAPI